MKILLIGLILSSIFFTYSIAFAQESSPSALTVAKNIEYSLPYPGILPDNPLYFLKVIRDNVVGFFVSDDLKKADYDLLMADKRLVSAKALIDKKNYDLGITTVSKAENYFERSVQIVGDQKKQGRDVGPTLDKLLTASQKHQQIISLMAKETKGNTRLLLELNQVRAKNFQDILSVISSQ